MSRWLAIVHQLPDRTRLRTPHLRGQPDDCNRLADALAAIPGVREVRIRPYTGSVLIEHDDRVPTGSLVDAVRGALAIDRVLAAGERPPIDGDVPAFSTIARELVLAVRDIDLEIRRHSDGAIDLGLLATLGFLGVGAADVVGTGKLPLPPWFNMAWWAFRTFMTTTHRAFHDHEEEDDDKPPARTG